MHIKRQSGMTIWGWLMIAIVAGFALLQGLKLFPPIMNYNVLDSMTTSAVSDYNSGKLQSKSDLIDRLQKTAQLNDVPNFRVKGKSSNVVFDNRSSKPKLKVVYEQRVDYFWDVDLIVSFDKEYELKR